MCTRLHSVYRDFTLAFLGICLLVFSAHAASFNSVVGYWATEDGHGVVAIEPCGDALCGRIVGIARAPGAPLPRDVHGVSECGLTIISKEKYTGDGAWLGEIVDPRAGKSYGAKLRVDEDGNLRLRAFLAVTLLGETRIWHPFKGHLADACRLE